MIMNINAEILQEILITVGRMVATREHVMIIIQIVNVHLLSSIIPAADGNKKDTPQTSSVKTRQQILEERAIKIKISEARERYFKRRGVATQ